MLQAAQGSFSLSFAVCNDRILRDDLIGLVRKDFPGLVIVTLSPETADVHRAVLAQHSSSQPEAIFILDLEALLPLQDRTYPILRVLNSSREAWEGLNCPVVFWLAEYAATLIAAQAQDFWRYRSHQFEFVAERGGLSEAMQEPFSGYPMVDGLSFAEKRFRMTELEQRIREADESPSAGLETHLVAWLSELAYLYRLFNQFRQAESLLRRALGIAEASYGPDHPEVASRLNNLAQLLQVINRLAETEPLLRRALAIVESSYGPDHPHVAVILNNLARLLKDTNRLAAAEPLIRRALAIDEMSSGPDSPNVAIRLNNLAMMLQDSNRLSEAEPLIRRALVIDEASYGPDHPNVASRLSNLAQLLQASNRLAAAEPLMRRALAINEASFGPDHPNVAVSLNNLAILFQATNRLAEAEPLMRRALAINEASYGPEHPAVAIRLNNLAQLLQNTDRLTAAEPLMRRSLAIAETSYGPDHPTVATTLNNLAVLLQATNRLTEAESLMRRGVEILRSFGRRTGHQHPKMAEAITNYRRLLRKMWLTPAEIEKRIAGWLGESANPKKLGAKKSVGKKQRRKGQRHRR